MRQLHQLVATLVIRFPFVSLEGLCLSIYTQQGIARIVARVRLAPKLRAILMYHMMASLGHLGPMYECREMILWCSMRQRMSCPHSYATPLVQISRNVHSTIKYLYLLGHFK